ncbi:MAG: phosphoribosylformylglycinamidine cyclo-ligase [Planctomycetota bacterium]
MPRKGLTYRDAGVDIDAGNDLARMYVRCIHSTLGPQVIPNDGGYAGLYRLRGAPGLFERKFSDPVLVSGTDGVGTKLKIAFALHRHDTVGIDLVAMNVNDILVQGAEPLFFLDYIATGKVEKEVLSAVVQGVAEGCRRAGCALLGGETAEMPGFYAEGEYDLAGFAVGVVERKRLLTGRTIGPGDRILGLASSGLHSNGYSLARKALLETGGLDLHAFQRALGSSLGEALLTPTRIYVQPVLSVLRGYRVKKAVKGIAHITGGGFLDNIPRILPPGCDAEIRVDRWKVPPIFDLIAHAGRIPKQELFRVFNMGIGMVMIVSPYSAQAIQARLRRQGEEVVEIGRIVRGKGEVRLAGL